MDIPQSQEAERARRTEDPAGNTGEGVDAGGKSEKQRLKENEKAAKAAKFAAKQQAKSAKSESHSKETNPKEKKTSSVDISQLVETTPPGQKKKLVPLDSVAGKSYLPAVVESSWYSWWEEQGFFKPEYGGRDEPAGYFVIAQPPPNVTGALHCGHALGSTLQDALIRWNRMKGLKTLYIPGCDHASISTQNVVEKMLWRQEKKTRHDLGRPKFVKLAWDWKEEYHSKINAALRRMGASLDWSREAFTMDSNLTVAVMETFCRLHEEGYIYRANRLVNWCTQLNTALSNLEVINKELAGRTMVTVPGYDRKIEFGVLFHFRYPIIGLDEERSIEVATTRPETMLGDTGIAVNPTDERYKDLIGKKAKHPFVDRLLPIVADAHVDPAFGTGAVKITPAHDQNDFEIGRRHGLETINILNDDGTLNDAAGSIFSGQKRFDARYTVVEQLTQLGLFVKKTENPMIVPLCERSGDVIEPLIKPQWWCRMGSMAQSAISAVESGELKIMPESAERFFTRWLENTQDWCLSRQLWWGHQVPAYRIELEDEEGVTDESMLWVVGRTEDEAKNRATAKFPNQKFSLTQDSDVLDTWFSSALWPFATLGWPRSTPDIEKFYPNSLLETGWDILPHWVARMVMFGIKLTGRSPFSEVFCHALVRDTEGRKMSKSLGNVIDPVDLINGIELESLHAKLLTGNLDPKEVKKATLFQKAAFPDGIPECGVDALRFCLAQYATGNEISFDIKVMHAHRRFCNKIFQATRYVLGKIGPNFVPQTAMAKTGKESLSERWILHRFAIAARDVNLALGNKAFPKVTQALHTFWYDNLCDVFIENSKAVLHENTSETIMHTLYNVLEGALRLIHPLMPYLSEELWQRLGRRPGEQTPSVVVAAYPQFDPSWIDTEAEEAYNLVLSCSRAIRSVAGEYGIKSALPVFIQTSTSTLSRQISDNIRDISALLGTFSSPPSIDILPQSQDPPAGCAVYVVSADVVIFLLVKGHIDLAAETAKLKTKIQQSTNTIAKIEAQLISSEKAENSSEEAREGFRQSLKDQETRRINYERTLKQLSGLVLSER